MSKETTKESSIRTKVVPSLITAAIIGLITTLVPGGWNWVFTQFQIAWKWLGGAVLIPVWLVVILSLLSLAAVVTVGVVAYAVMRNPESNFAARYTEDTIFGVRWRGSYGQHGIYDLCAFCPACDMQVYSRPATSYEALGSVKYHCDDCGTDLQRFEFGNEEVESRVIRKIQQKLRSAVRDKETDTP